MTHLDADQLADLDEGLLPPAQATEARSHLETCSECARRYDDLLAVRQLLARAPSPVMPQTLAARIDAAIATESSRRIGATNIRSLEHARSRRPAWLPKALVAAAGVTVLALTGNSVLNRTDGPAGSTQAQSLDDAASGSAAPESAATPLDQMLVDKVTQLQKSPTFSAALDAAVGDKVSISGGEPPPSLVPEDSNRSCVTAALGGALPRDWYSRPADLGGRRVTLVLARPGGSRLHAWAVDCNGTPEVLASAGIPPR